MDKRMNKREKPDTLVLVSTALFLFFFVSSSIVLAANNGNVLTFQGNYENAIKAYDKAIETNSQGSDAWYYKGVVLAFQGDYEEAIKDFDKATEIDPQFASAWYNKGLCLVNLCNYEEAIKAFDKAIEIVPQSLDVWVNKGVCLAKLGNYEEAIKAFDKAIEINSQNLDVWSGKGFCFMHLGYYEEAIKAYDKAIEIDPQNRNVLINKGACLGNLGYYDEAIKAYDKAIEIDPQDSEAWYNKGNILAFNKGNYEEAIIAYDKAIEIDSHNSDACYNKGLCLVYLGNYGEAIKAYNKAIEINSQDPYAWYYKGLCLAHLGKYKEAVEALDKAIEIDPQNSEALSLKESILSNSNGLMMSLRSLFSNNNIFVEEDDLLEYAQTYLKTYGDVINESNLTHDDLRLFSFYQSYPYSVNATISNTYGASITFIPHSIDKSKVTRVSYPIEELIPKIGKERMDNIPRRVSINGNSSGIFMYDNSLNGGFIYVNNSNNNCLYQLTDNSLIILSKGTYFNGTTYIDSNKLFREGNLIINGTLVLNNSKVIMKSDLKKDWTKEKAEEDVIDSVYKELINKILDYSKLTGIGFREIEPLVAEYKEKENSGYYKTNKYEKWKDRQTILNKADQYRIPHDSVLVELLDNKQDEKLYEKALRYAGSLLTVKELAAIIIGIIGWIKRKELHQKFIKFRHKFVEIVSWIKKRYMSKIEN